MIVVIYYKLWCIKCPRNFPLPLWMLLFISLFLLLHVRPSDALGLKAKVNKKGEFPPCGVGKVPQSIIYVGGGGICPP